MLGYEQLEIAAPRRNWIDWLRSMTKGEQRIADLQDRGVISAVVSRLHRQTGGKVKFKLKKENDTLLIIREL